MPLRTCIFRAYTSLLTQLAGTFSSKSKSRKSQYTADKKIGEVIIYPVTAFALQVQGIDMSGYWAAQKNTPTARLSPAAAPAPSNSSHGSGSDNKSNWDREDNSYPTSTKKRKTSTENFDKVGVIDLT